MSAQTPEQEATEAQAAALVDFLAGQLGKEFTEKAADRGIADRDVERVLRSRSSGVWRYRHYGQPRYGFWHPQTQYFVAWRPAAEGWSSEVKSCFYEEDADRYLADQDESVCLRRPR